MPAMAATVPGAPAAPAYFRSVDGASSADGGSATGGGAEGANGGDGGAASADAV
jgi:hypothetical protein